MAMSDLNTPASITPERVEHRPKAVAPFVDVFENTTELLLLADVPGATREGIDVHVDKGELTLFARRAPAPEGAPAAHDYHRVFALPQGIDGSKIAAELNAGVLTVHLPKSDALRPRRIDVKAS
jgi:HSP20 family molecular chaperone IbpA